jgi:hypothetical protein
MNLDQFKRKYRYKGADTDKEQKVFWIAGLVGLAIIIALIYFF